MRSFAWALISLAAPAVLTGQGGNSRSSAPIDLTGYWVSVVTEDWAWRMVTPHKGDYASVPLNDEGRRVAGMWEPAEERRALQRERRRDGVLRSSHGIERRVVHRDDDRRGSEVPAAAVHHEH